MRFKNAACIRGWQGEILARFFRTTLEGPPERVVAQMSEYATFEQMCDRLLLKYGAESRQLTFETQLEQRKQRPNETFEKLAEALDDLISGAFPSITGREREKLLLKHFMTAIDPQLALSLQMMQPTTIEDAVLKCLQYNKWYARMDDTTVTKAEPHRGGNATQDKLATAAQIEQLTKQVKLIATKVDQGKNDDDRRTLSQEEYMQQRHPQSTQQRNFSNYQQRRQPADNAGSPRVVKADAECFSCHEKGHYRTDPVCKNYDPNAPYNRRATTSTATVSTATANAPQQPESQPPVSNFKGLGILSPAPQDIVTEKEKPVSLGTSPKPTTYLIVGLLGRAIPALLDTGADRSVIGTCLLAGAKIRPCNLRLQAANGQPMTVRGETEVELRIGHETVPSTLLVTDEVKDLILGIDWLRKNKCLWDFDPSMLIFRKRHYKLGYCNPKSNTVRRIFASSDVTLEDNHVTMVSAIRPYCSSLSGDSDSSVEAVYDYSVHLEEGLVVPEMVVDDLTYEIKIPIVNMTGRKQVFRCGKFLRQKLC